MTLIQSVKDLARAREDAQARARARLEKYRFHIRVGMASCSLAVGAQATLDAINDTIAANRLEEVLVTKTGCIGLCALEPIVQVEERGMTSITYGKVTPEIARRIIKEHIEAGMVVQPYTIEMT